MRRSLIVVAAGLAAAGVSTVLAQTVQGIDLGAIRANAAKYAADAEALSQEVERRSEVVREQAQPVVEGAMSNLKKLDASTLPKGPEGAFDFDQIVTAATDNLKEGQGSGPLFIVFASLSMPEPTLKQLIADTSKAGGMVVFRGFPNNSAKEFTSRVMRVVEQDQMAHVGIDPRLFRAFDITAAPTYVVSSTDFDLCEGLSCKTPTPPHDRMTGNVTVEYALESFAGDNGPGAQIARTALAQFRKASRQ